MSNRRMAHNIHLPLRHQIFIHISALPLLMSPAMGQCYISSWNEAE